MAVQRSGRLSTIPARVFDDSRIEAAAIRVLGILGCYGNRDGWAWPKLATVAARARVSIPAVRKQIAILIDAGYIEKQSQFRADGSQSSNMYRILFDAAGAEPEPDEMDDEAYNDEDPEVVPTLHPRYTPPCTPVAPQALHPRCTPRTSHSNGTYNGDTDSGESVAPPTKKPRVRNPHWDALAEGIGTSPATKTEIGQHAAAVKELREAGYTPEQISRACAEHRRQWPRLTVTASSIKKNISMLLATAAPTRRRSGNDWDDSPEMVL